MHQLAYEYMLHMQDDSEIYHIIVCEKTTKTITTTTTTTMIIIITTFEMHHCRGDHHTSGSHQSLLLRSSCTSYYPSKISIFLALVQVDMKVRGDPFPGVFSSPDIFVRLRVHLPNTQELPHGFDQSF